MARKGQITNPKGRPKGVPNKATKAAREILIPLINKLTPEVEGKLEQLEPRDWLHFYTKLLEYAVPKVSPIQAPESIEDRPNVVIRV